MQKDGSIIGRRSIFLFAIFFHQNLPQFHFFSVVYRVCSTADRSVLRLTASSYYILSLLSLATYYLLRYVCWHAKILGFPSNGKCHRRPNSPGSKLSTRCQWLKNYKHNVQQERKQAILSDRRAKQGCGRQASS